MLPAVLARILSLSLLFAFATGCDKAPAEAVQTHSAAAPAAEPKASPASQTVARVASRPNERPIPNFEGRTLDGKRLAISSLIGKRFLMFFFNPEVPTAVEVGKAIRTLAALRPGGGAPGEYGEPMGRVVDHASIRSPSGLVH